MHRLKKLFSLGVPDVKELMGQQILRASRRRDNRVKRILIMAGDCAVLSMQVLRRCHHFYNAYIVRKGIRRLLTRLSSDK